MNEPDSPSTERAPARLPGKGDLYAATKIVLGEEPTAWILAHRGEKRPWSFDRMAQRISQMFEDAGSPEVSVTSESVRRWHMIAVAEQEERTAEHERQAATASERAARRRQTNPDVPPATFQGPA